GAELRGSPRPARPRRLRKRERHRSARQQQRAERERKPKLPGGAEVEQGKQHRGQPEGGRVCPYLGPVALSDQSSGCLGKTGTVGRNALEPETAGKLVIAEVVAGIAGSRDGEQDKLAERERRQPGKQRVGDAPGPRRDPARHPGQPCPRAEE